MFLPISDATTCGGHCRVVPTYKSLRGDLFAKKHPDALMVGSPIDTLSLFISNNHMGVF